MSTRANLGRAWEARLLAWHHAYKQAGDAFVVQAPPPVRMISKPRQGRFMAVYMKDGPPDFVGVALGRPVVFDAKSTAQPRWSLAEIQPHQARDLEAATRAGAFAFIALDLQGDHWVLPWALLAPRWVAHPRSSLSSDDLSGMAMRMDSDDGWLPVAEPLLRELK